MNESYIKLLRKLTEWEWYKDSQMVHLFIHLLLKANFLDGNFQGKKVMRGQLITGTNSLAESTGMTRQSIRTCLNKLKLTNEITIKSTNKNSLVTIVKYNDYQSFESKSTNKSTTKLTIKQPTTNQQLTTIEEGNKEEEYLLIFDSFRKKYPGTKNGNETEFKNFCKKHKDWETVLLLLESAIDNQIYVKKNKQGFVPEWKNLQTWINQRCWEEETSRTVIINNNGGYKAGTDGIL